MANRIYVGNLPYSASSDQLSQIFAAYGSVIDATVITDRDTGQNKGFGFVEMADEGGAQAAITALNGTDMDGRTIRVSEAQPRPERQGGYSQRPRRDDR